MGASAKLEVPIPRGKNGCANLNEKMGRKVGSGQWTVEEEDLWFPRRTWEPEEQERRNQGNYY
jgi:hypothetical protein